MEARITKHLLVNAATVSAVMSLVGLCLAICVYMISFVLAFF